MQTKIDARPSIKSVRRRPLAGSAEAFGREYDLVPARPFPKDSTDLSGWRVLLIYPPVRLSAKPMYPPFGLMSLAAVLEQSGATVEILDLNLRRLDFAALQTELDTRQFDLVGIGGMTTVYYYIKFLAIYLRKTFPEIPIIGGGSACSASPDTVLRSTPIDVVCVGEGEPVIVELVDKMLRGADLTGIAGIRFRGSDGEAAASELRPRMANIEDLPRPAYDLVDMEAYIQNGSHSKHGDNPMMARRIRELGIDPQKARRPVMIFSKRGCPFACNFCYRNFGRKVVGSPVEHTLAHMRYLEEHFGTVHFVFGDEIFNIDKKWVHALCQRLIDEGRNYILATINGLRANLIDSELLDIMRRAGFCSIGIGIESFYDATLKAMGKGQKATQIHSALRQARDAGFPISSAQLLFGYESDGKESMAANLKALDELEFNGAGFSIPCPYPGTELYHRAVERGMVGDEEGWLMELADRDISDRTINMSSLSDRELSRLVTYGRDQAILNGLRRQYPVLGPVFAVVQHCVRKVTGRDAFSLLTKCVSWLRKAVSERKSSASWETSEAGDQHICTEVFEQLDRWEREGPADNSATSRTPMACVQTAE